MSALPLIAQDTDGQGARPQPAGDRAGLATPPPLPTATATPAQVRASLDLGLAEARAGIGEDFEAVQARLRAKFFSPSR